MNDLILLESQSARNEVINNVDTEKAIKCLHKAKALVMSVYQGTGAATTKEMAEYYEVPIDAVESALRRDKLELKSDGLRVLTGRELKKYLSASLAESQSKAPSSLTIWTPRAALRLGMLLRDSPIAKAVRTEMLDIAESKPVHDLQTLLEASATIIAEHERILDENDQLKKELKEMRSVKSDLAEIKYKLDSLIHTAQHKAAAQATPKLAPIQQDLPLDIEQRFNESKKALLAAKTLENEAKAKALTNKFAPKPKPTPEDIANLIKTNSVAAWANERIVLEPTAKTYVGKANGNPDTHLYPNYVNYCKQHRLELVTMQAFSKVLMSLVETTLAYRLSKQRDKEGCHIKGVAIGEAKNLLMAA